MRVEIVHHEGDAFGLRIHFVDKELDFVRPVEGGAVFLRANAVPAPKRFDEGENAAGSVPDLFGIDFFVVAGPHGPRVARIAQQLVRFLVHADDGMVLVVGAFVDVQHVLHGRDEIGVGFLGEAPVVGAMGPQLVFLSALRMVSLLMGSERTTLSSFSSSRRVHRAAPLGAGPHAVAIRRASALPSSFRRAWFERGLRCNVKTDSMPLQAKWRTVLATVAMQRP